MKRFTPTVLVFGIASGCLLIALEYWLRRQLGHTHYFSTWSPMGRRALAHAIVRQALLGAVVVFALVVVLRGRQRNKGAVVKPVKLQPEASYVVTVTNEEIQNRCPDGSIQSIPRNALRRILIETNDSGPWGMDVWWVLEGPSSSAVVSFPQGATGEDEFIRFASTLPGFVMRGMNSAHNARFECWPNPSP